MRFETKVAIRHLRYGGTQTWLTVGTVALGAFIIIFLSSLINGVQQGLIRNVVGSIPTIVISAPDYEPTPPWETDAIPNDEGAITSQIERYDRQQTTIEQWENLAESIESLPGVAAVAPAAQGGGIVNKGARSESILIIGVIPERQLEIIRLRDRIVSGNFEELDSEGAFIGITLAENLGITSGDRIRITSGEGNTRVFTVRGIFDLGLQNANESWIYLQLRPAQGLLDIGTDVTAVNVKVEELFEAENIARRIRSITPLEVESWMETNQSFLEALQSQTLAAGTIQFVAILAAAFGVSSVLIVFVVQKSRDIGILKSMGATGGQIKRIFTSEGLAIGAGGAAIGSILGTAVCLIIENTEAPNRQFAGEPATIIPMEWSIVYVIAAVIVSVVVGLLSSYFPARRAANLNPVEVIRGG